MTAPSTTLPSASGAPVRTRRLRAASLAAGLALVLSPLVTSASAEASSSRTLEDFARAGVTDSSDNLTSPSSGVSRVHLDKGQMNGFKVRSAIPAAQEATLTYQVRVPGDVRDNGLSKVDLKLPGLAGAPTSKSLWYASSGGTLQSDSFSVRLHARKSSDYSVGYPHLDAYVYAPRAAGKSWKDWGISVPVTSGANGAGSRLAIPADRWFEVKVHVGLNTPGKDDGVLEVSVDGVKGVALKDVRWRQAGVTTPVNMLMAETFYNSPGAPKDGHIDFRDFRVTSGASTPAPPTTPAPTKPPVTTPAAPALASERAFREVSNGWGPVEVNRSNGTGKKGDGGVLKIGTTTFTKGFGVHAASEVVVPVQGARKFTASVGLDADAGKKGTVVFQVFDGTRKLADSGLLKGGSGPRTLTADVTGAKEVRLVVTNAGDGSSQDHSVWGNPRFS